MKVVVIEDEVYSQEKLTTLLTAVNRNIEVMAVLDSVKDSINWFNANEKPDLVFVDIELRDGNSFEIFELIPVSFPVVFITAYENYAVQAFKVNSLDYILKPIQKEDVSNCIIKYYDSTEIELSQLRHKILESDFFAKHKYKSRFISKKGDRYDFISVDDIAFIYLELAGTALYTWSYEKHYIEYNLDTLQNILNPDKFFRINRTIIANINSIDQVIKFSKRRLKIILKNFDKGEVIMSREKVSHFKAWLDY